jgi:hypothetical protein
MLPCEFQKYRTIMPWKLGAAMTAGWQPVAALNYHRTIKGQGTVQETRYLVGKDPKNSVVVPVPISHQAPYQQPQTQVPIPELRGGSVGAELSYPKDDPPPEPPSADPPPETEAEASPAPAVEPDDEVDQVARDMDELLDGKPGDDDGSEDDDE